MPHYESFGDFLKQSGKRKVRRLLKEGVLVECPATKAFLTAKTPSTG